MQKWSREILRVIWDFFWCFLLNIFFRKFILSSAVAILIWFILFLYFHYGSSSIKPQYELLFDVIPVTIAGFYLILLLTYPILIQ